MPVMDKADIERLIKQNQRRLVKLKEQKALSGMSVDPRVIIEIEDIEKEIEKLQADLEIFKARDVG